MKHNFRRQGVVALLLTSDQVGSPLNDRDQATHGGDSDDRRQNQR